MEVKVINHSIAKHYLTILRDKTTNPDEFRKATNKLSGLLITEATREINLNEKKIDTPLAPYIGSEVSVGSVAVPVLRAGLGLLEGVQNILPNLTVGYIGIQRNEETSNPEDYYSKLPNLIERDIYVLEPMLATGGSLNFAISKIKEAGGTNISAICVVSSPEGIKKIENERPDIKLFTASIDEGLDDNWYIVPGLGDMGDRLFGTL